MQIKTASVEALQNNTEKFIEDVIINGKVLYVSADERIAVVIILEEWNAFR